MAGLGCIWCDFPDSHADVKPHVPTSHVRTKKHEGVPPRHLDAQGFITFQRFRSDFDFRHFRHDGFERGCVVMVRIVGVEFLIAE